MISDPQFFEGSGFIGVDVGTRLTDDELRKDRDRLILEKLHRSEVHPDAWPAALIRNPEDSEARLAAVAGDKYSYRELDDFTDLISRTILGAPEVRRLTAREYFLNKSTWIILRTGWLSMA
jgi:hypothetical protein